MKTFKKIISIHPPFEKVSAEFLKDIDIYVKMHISRDLKYL